jgi:hypothetical protein
MRQSSERRAGDGAGACMPDVMLSGIVSRLSEIVVIGTFMIPGEGSQGETYISEMRTVKRCDLHDHCVKD